MGRNYKKNKNLTVPLDRNGETLRDLLATAGVMSNQLGVYAGQCLAEYFKARREGRIMPEGMTFYAVAAPSGMMQGLPISTPPMAAAAPTLDNHHQNGNGSNGTTAAELERLASRPEVIDLNTDGGDDDDLSFYFNQEEDDE